MIWLQIFKTKTTKVYTTNNKNIKSNDIRIISKNVITSCIYRAPRSDARRFSAEMKNHIIKNKFYEKPLLLVDDLNIISLDYCRNTHARDISNFLFQSGIFPVISCDRPTRVTKSNAIDHILIHTIIDSHIQMVQ